MEYIMVSSTVSLAFLNSFEFEQLSYTSYHQYKPEGMIPNAVNNIPVSNKSILQWRQYLTS